MHRQQEWGHQRKQMNHRYFVALQKTLMRALDRWSRLRLTRTLSAKHNVFVSATQEWFKKCTTSTMRNYAEIWLAGREGVWMEREWPTFPMERSSLSKNNTTPSVVKITPKLVIPIPISGKPDEESSPCSGRVSLFHGRVQKILMC